MSLRFHQEGHHATYMSHICVCDKRHALIISFGVASSLFSALNIATFSTLEFLHDWPRHASVILPLRPQGGPQKEEFHLIAIGVAVGTLEVITRTL